MNAYDYIQTIFKNDNITNAHLKYALMDNNKIPYNIDNVCAKPNNIADFSDIYDFLIYNDKVMNYAGLGISIQASNISAIDVDHCFEKAFDLSSADDRAKDIINIFKDKAYIEFSFSGHGLRIFLKTNDIKNYVDTYYIKNSKNGIEFYQPSNPARFISITGNTIQDHSLTEVLDNPTIFDFLNKYMQRPKRSNVDCSGAKINCDKTFEELKQLMKHHIYTNTLFQSLVFTNPPGSGSNESELDFSIIKYIYLNITTDKENIKKLFEDTYYYKHKDYKHKNKWIYNNNRYFETVYDNIQKGR